MQGEATVPSNMGDELDTNPFLRPSDPNIRKKLGEQSTHGMCYTLLADTCLASLARYTVVYSSAGERILMCPMCLTENTLHWIS